MNALGVRPSFATGFAQGPGESEYPELWRGLVGAWGPSLGQTGSRLIDWSGKGNHGIFGAGALSPSWVAGKFGSALSFDGGDHVLTTLSPYAIHNATTGDLTINIWVLFNVDYNNHAPIGADDGGADRFYLNCQGSTGLRVGIGSWSIVYNNVVYINKWTLLSVVIRGTTGYFYVNGELRGTEVGITLDYPTTPIYFGQIRDGGTYQLDGLLDNISIYNRALIPAEISLLHQLRKQVA